MVSDSISMSLKRATVRPGRIKLRASDVEVGLHLHCRHFYPHLFQAEDANNRPAYFLIERGKDHSLPNGTRE